MTVSNNNCDFANQVGSGYVKMACAQDIPAIDLLIQRVWDDSSTDLKCLPGESRFTANELPAYMDDAANSTIVFLQPDETIVGVLFLSSVAPTVWELGISAFPYGSGVGSRLIGAALERGTACGITEIYLDVFERNPAVRLYERKGFSTFDRLFVTNQRGEELALLRMRIALVVPSRGVSGNDLPQRHDFVPPSSYQRLVFRWINWLRRLF